MQKQADPNAVTQTLRQRICEKAKFNGLFSNCATEESTGDPHEESGQTDRA